MTTTRKVNINEFLEKLQEIIDNADDSQFRRQLENLSEEVEKVQDHLTDNRTGKGLLTRMALAENEIQDLQQWKTTQGTIIAADKSGKWTLLAAIATGAIPGIISIILHLLRH
jgi:predicted nuclease with TOPRIM domain